MIRKFGSRRASTAARMRLSAVSSSTTALPSRWPQRFGLTWSSRCMPARPGVLEHLHGAGDVHRLAEAGVGVDERGQVGHPRDLLAAAGDLGEGREADVGQPEVGAEHGARDVDALEALVLDEPRAEQRVEARPATAAASPLARPRRGSGRALRRHAVVGASSSIRTVPSGPERRRARRAPRRSSAAPTSAGVSSGSRCGELEEPLDLGRLEHAARPACGTCAT